MTLTGQGLAHAWSPEEYDPIATAIAEAGAAFLPVAAETAAKLAGDHYHRACFVGSTAMAGAAQEAALKLLELTAGEIKTMSQATLALRHGPMAALDRDTLFVSFLSTQTKRQRYELDLLREIERKDLVKQSIAIAGSGVIELPSLEKTLVVGPSKTFEVPDLYRPVTDIVFGQLLGLFASLACGLTPDTPSPNGAITRVVQPIEIH
jgi:tagatose-6-phosphate ketose/aldose isomerase